MTTPLNIETIKKAPKALLHDHLDGGLRPATVLDIAGQIGYDGLPATDVDSLAQWFRTASHSGSLERYLEPFSHTVAVMQTPESLHRVAYECVEDLSADSVVYAEVRFAPELHINGGLSFDAVVDAVLAGFADGEKAAAAAGHPIVVRCLVTAMRHAAVSREIAELAIRFRDKGVVGFDIAGAEAGYPPTRHLDAFEYMRERRSGCRRFRRRSPTAVPIGWATACVSSTTSTSQTTARCGSAGSRPSCGTSGFRWRCVRAPMCRPVRPPASPSIRSTCWPAPDSG
jgi:adenosine deaminase